MKKKTDTDKHAQEAFLFGGGNGPLSAEQIHAMSRTELEERVLQLQKRVISRERQAGHPRKGGRDRQFHQVMALESAGMVTWEWDIPKHSVRYSANVSDIVRGTQVQPFCSVDSLMERIHPEDRERLARSLDQTSATGTPWECEYRALMLDGTYRWILGRGGHVILKEGKPVRVLGVSVDITERKLTEDALRQARDNLEIHVRQRTLELEQANRALQSEIVEHLRTEDALREIEARFVQSNGQSRTVTWEVDADGLYSYVSPVIQGVYGYKPEELVGRIYFYDLHPENGREAFKAAAFEVFRRQESFEDFENPVLTQDGRTLWVLTSAFPLLKPDGSLRGYRGNDTDITELKRTQEALLARTQELTAANRELEAFSYSASHDLRAPLLIIRSYSALMLADCSAKVDAVCKDYLTRIDAATRKMVGLIDDMLRLSKISRQEISLQQVDLSALASAIIDELRRAQPARHVDVTVQPDCRAQGDPRLLYIALSNLLGNAWKFTGKTERPAIEFGRIGQDDATVFFVRDNGAGFAQSQAQRLFEPFKRAHSEKEFPGTGIGLAIVERIISRHGGRIWAEAQEGKGASFFFTLPCESR
jgi:PAS domain S-box-containing protein